MLSRKFLGKTNRSFTTRSTSTAAVSCRCFLSLFAVVCRCGLVCLTAGAFHCCCSHCWCVSLLLLSLLVRFTAAALTAAALTAAALTAGVSQVSVLLSRV